MQPANSQFGINRGHGPLLPGDHAHRLAASGIPPFFNRPVNSTPTPMPDSLNNAGKPSQPQHPGAFQKRLQQRLISLAFSKVLNLIKQLHEVEAKKL